MAQGAFYVAVLLRGRNRADRRTYCSPVQLSLCADRSSCFSRYLLNGLAIDGNAYESRSFIVPQKQAVAIRSGVLSILRSSAVMANACRLGHLLEVDMGDEGDAAGY
ncbi:hypothetical protein D3C77_539090 [compost metagenome]